MSELLKLLDGSIDEVKAGLTGKSRAELDQLRKAEPDGKSRTGALAAIDEALANAGDATEANGAGAGEADGFEASGAPHQIVDDVDASHPALDADPRANTTAEQNRIDFNDPSLEAGEAVRRNLENK